MTDPLALASANAKLRMLNVSPALWKLLYLRECERLDLIAHGTLGAEALLEARREVFAELARKR
ncbi:MAG: hypothetical protein QM813_17170 [Verrucomicrobiota bacterium]